MTELKIYPDAVGGPLRTGIPKSLMYEVAEHLERFVETGETHKIDLKSLPATPTDLEDIDAVLGVGEVRADLAVIGRSAAWETAFAGVWRVRHFASNDAVAADEIVIAAAPDILLSHVEDARAALGRLREAAASFNPSPLKEDPAHV